MRLKSGLKAPFIVILALLMSFSGAARAEENAGGAREPEMCPFCLKANDPDSSYLDKSGNILMRGVLNTTLGWTEVLRLPAKQARKDGNIWNGLADGLGSGVTRTLNGLAEIVTFWTPKVNGSFVHFSDDCPLDTNK